MRGMAVSSQLSHSGHNRLGVVQWMALTADAEGAGGWARPRNDAQEISAVATCCRRDSASSSISLALSGTELTGSMVASPPSSGSAPSSLAWAPGVRERASARFERCPGRTLRPVSGTGQRSGNVHRLPYMAHSDAGTRDRDCSTLAADVIVNIVHSLRNAPSVHSLSPVAFRGGGALLRT